MWKVFSSSPPPTNDPGLVSFGVGPVLFIEIELVAGSLGPALEEVGAFHLACSATCVGADWELTSTAAIAPLLVTPLVLGRLGWGNRATFPRH